MCGKTTFLKNMLARKSEMFNVNFKQIIWCYSESAAKPNVEDVKFHKGLIKDFENEHNIETLLIIDDLMSDAYNSQISELFTRGSHHRNFSIILVTQNAFYQSTHSRTISLNTKYMILFKNPRDKQQFSFLARQIYPENSKELLRVYNEVMKKPHAYFIIDLTQDCNELLRFRTDIFNSNYLAICYTNVEDNNEIESETIEGEQAHVIRA